MAIEYVNGAVNYDAAGGTSIASPAANHTSGNLLVVMASSGEGDGTDVDSITDTAGNTYTRITGAVYGAGWIECEMWYAKNITGNANNIVTVTFNASYLRRGIQVLQYSGCDPTAPLDQFTAANGYTAAPITPDIITTSANEVLVAVDALYAAKTHTAGTNYIIRTMLSGSEPSPGDSEDQIVSATGTYNASYTISASTPWAMVLASFIEGEAPPPPPPEVKKAEAIKVTPRIESSPCIPLTRNTVRAKYGIEGWDKFNL